MVKGRNKSAEKRHRQSERARERNKKYRTVVRAAVKDARAEKNQDKKKQAVKETSQILDKVARKGIIHKNKAARLKSRLAKSLKRK